MRQPPKRELAEAGKMTRKLKELRSSDADWLRGALLANEYWSLWFFCRVALGYKDLTADLHLLYCEVLDSDISQYKLVMMAREFIKSWILRGKMARDYLRDNNRRFLYMMATEDLARDASDQFGKIFTNNELIRFLWPDCMADKQTEDRWTALARTLPRTIDSPEPTVKFAGTNTELTSGHYESIFFDDIFALNAAESAEIAKRVRKAYVAAQPLLHQCPEKQMVHVCTRWGVEDLVADIMGEDHQYTDEVISWARGDKRYLVMKVGLRWPDGKPAWPAVWNEDRIAETEEAYRSMGKEFEFACQYLNNPIDEAVIEFPKPRYWERVDKDHINLLQPFGREPVLIDTRQLTRTMTIDPAYTTGKQSDYSAICVIGSHPEGYRINLYSWTGKMESVPLKKKIIDVYLEAYDKGIPIDWVGVDDIGPQVAFRQALVEEANNRRVYLPLRSVRHDSEASKKFRIRQMIDFLRDGKYYTHKDFYQANWELRNFPSSKKDHWLDAFASQPKLWGISAMQPIEEESPPPWKHQSHWFNEQREGLPKWEGYGG